MVYMYIYVLWLSSLTTFMLSFMLLYMKSVLFFQWVLFQGLTFTLEFIIYVDWMTMIFLSLVSLISSFVVYYSTFYMEADKNFYRFIYLILLFVVSMYFMILSPCIVSILLGWDGLGLVSYCLVIYYQSFKSLNCGMVTVLSNRIGDIGILMMISLLLVKGSWNLFFYNSSMSILTFFLILSAFTKSAQLPFSVWLPMAMAAPTPVSALVHSSTLVTAGVYLLIRYNIFLEGDFNKNMLLLSSLTMFMAGLSANFETDLKKIIALSTLSQLGLMMSILSVGEIYLGFFHLVMHALFKSLLFMCSGVIIHMMLNSQDIRFMGGMIKFFPSLSMIFFFSSLSLCGFPFLSGFYSKDLIMEFFLMSKMNMLSLIIIFMATVFTVSYSVRLIFLVYLNSVSLNNYNIVIDEDKGMLSSMVVLFLFSIFGGFMFSGLFFYVDYTVILKFMEKTLVLFICVVGGVIGWLLAYFGSSWLMCSYLKIYLSKMFGLEVMFSSGYSGLNSMILNFKMKGDKGNIEYFFIKGVKNELFIKALSSVTFDFSFVKNMLSYFLFFILVVSLIR